MEKEREKLIEELESLHQYGVKGILDTEIVINFILADRKRIVEPLVKYTTDRWALMEALPEANWVKAINETLKLAGLDNDS